MVPRTLWILEETLKDPGQNFQSVQFSQSPLPELRAEVIAKQTASIKSSLLSESRIMGVLMLQD